MASPNCKSSTSLSMVQSSRSSRHLSKASTLSVALLSMAAFLAGRSLSSSDAIPQLLASSSLMHATEETGSQGSSTRFLTSIPSEKLVSSATSGKQSDIMDLYLNHASTGNSYYQLIPKCLDPIQPKDYREIGRKLDSQKVMGTFELEYCSENLSHCARQEQFKETCRTWSFYYDSLYNQWLQPELAREDAEPFQAIEIGFNSGVGHEILAQVLPKAELHSLEMSCMPPGPREEGKWPWGNFAKESKRYETLLSNKRLHCGETYEYDFLHPTWSKYIHRLDAPPLKVVVENGSSQSRDMAASLFFWLPRLEPGGMFFVEGIRPDDKQGFGPADKFKTHIISQVMKDLHWCGNIAVHPDPTSDPDLCFPQLQPYLQGVHCEMHICVFVRNNRPAADPPKELSTVPSNAFENASKCLFGK